MTALFDCLWCILINVHWENNVRPSDTLADVSNVAGGGICNE